MISKRISQLQLVIVLLTISDGFLRFFDLTSQSFWIDEGFSTAAALAVKHHGYPLLPSGIVFFSSRGSPLLWKIRRWYREWLGDPLGGHLRVGRPGGGPRHGHRQRGDGHRCRHRGPGDQEKVTSGGSQGGRTDLPGWSVDGDPAGFIPPGNVHEAHRLDVGAGRYLIGQPTLDLVAGRDLRRLERR